MTLEATSPRLPPKIDSQESFLHACNRRGRDIVCKTTVYPLVMRDDVRPRGVIVLMDEMPADTPVDESGDGANRTKDTKAAEKPTTKR